MMLKFPSYTFFYLEYRKKTSIKTITNESKKELKTILIKYKKADSELLNPKDIPKNP